MQDDLKFVAKMISDNIGVKIEESNDFGWKANIDKRIIYYPKGTKFFDDSSVGYIIHEAGHIKHSILSLKYLDVMKKIASDKGKSGEQVVELINALEDSRVERKLCEKYPGARKYLDENNKVNYWLWRESVINDKYFDYKKYKTEWLNRKWFQFSIGAGFKGVGDVVDADEFIEILCSRKVKRYLKKCDKYFKKTKEADSIIELCEIIKKDILKYYIKLCNKEKKKKKDDKKEKDNNEMTKKELDKMMDEFIKQLKEGIKKVKEKKGKGSSTSAVKIKGAIESGGGTGIGLIGGQKPSEESFSEIQEMFSVRIHNLSIEELIESVSENLSKTRKAISVLKDIEFKRFESGYDSGKLDSRRIHKIFVGNTKIFKRKILPLEDNKDMAIAILVDESGSMNGTKSTEACKSVAILAKSLEMARRKFAIYGFNDNYYTHKDWNKKLSIPELLKIDVNSSEPAAEWNNDGYAIKRTVDILKKRPERNKILIVFSDGEPAPSRDTSPEGKIYNEYDLVEEVKKAEKVVKIYSIGIISDTVKEFYSTYKIVDDASELSVVLVDIFKKNAGKRIR